jgi:hypothetical protein
MQWRGWVEWKGSRWVRGDSRGREDNRIGRGQRREVKEMGTLTMGQRQAG